MTDKYTPKPFHKQRESSEGGSSSIGPLNLQDIQPTLKLTPITHFHDYLLERTDNLRILPGHLAIATSQVGSALIDLTEIYLVDSPTRKDSPAMGIVSGERLVDRARKLRGTQRAMAIEQISLLVEQEIGQFDLNSTLEATLHTQLRTLGAGVRIISHQLEASEHIHNLMAANFPEYSQSVTARHISQILASSNWRGYKDFINALVPQGSQTTVLPIVKHPDTSENK